MNQHNWKDWLSRRPKEMTGGIEIEMYLWDKETNKVNWSDDIIDEMLSELPEAVYKDYYPYQIEIRTHPHKTPEGMLRELRKNIQMTWESAQKFNLDIIPSSFLNSNVMYNGLHFHARYVNARNSFYPIMMNTYPFILSLTSFFRFARCKERSKVWKENVLSERFMSSIHIGLPYLNSGDFNNCNDGCDRYKDMTINKYSENNRHRLKSESTLETRCFDVPPTWESLSTMVHLLYNIFQRSKSNTSWLIDAGNPAKMPLSEYSEMAQALRGEIKNTKNTWNRFFEMPCVQLIREMIDYFDIPDATKSPPAWDTNLFWKNLEHGYPMVKKPIVLKKDVKRQLRPTGYSRSYITQEDLARGRRVVANFSGDDNQSRPPQPEPMENHWMDDEIAGDPDEEQEPERPSGLFTYSGPTTVEITPRRDNT